MQLETKIVGSELPLTPFNLTHTGLAAVKVDTFWQLTLHLNIRETETERERERLFKALKHILSYRSI